MNRVKIVWDEPKRRASIEKHGFDFADLTEEFLAAAVRVPAKAGRFMAIGGIGRDDRHRRPGGLGTEAISVISMRPGGPEGKEALAWPGPGPAS